jgi:putative RNA 2'-phosphotransferase
MSVEASKFLSLLLRHRPEEIGLELSSEGWALVSDLVELTRAHRVSFTHEQIEQLVRTSDKQRFELSSDGARVRACQGHSLPVDLGLLPQSPPDALYHGTATRFLDAILARGLVRGERRHVHLSSDADVARSVGQRHGEPVVLRVDARGLHDAGFAFFLSANAVWLTEFVPAAYLAVD